MDYFQGMDLPGSIGGFGSNGLIGGAPVVGPGVAMVPANAVEGLDLSGLDLSNASAPGMPSVLPEASALGGTPNAAAAGGGFGLEGIGSLMQGIASLGQIYASIKSLGLAQKQFDFTKKTWQTNLDNQTDTYNYNLKQRIESQFAQEDKTPKQARNYYRNNKL